MIREPILDIDHAILTDIVRRQQQDLDFEVLEWTVSMLSDRGGTSPDGVLRVSGSGRGASGARPWEVALKIIPQASEDVSPSSISNAHRVRLAHETGLLDRMPGPVIPARCYGVNQVPGAVWLWTELLTDAAGKRWSLDDYVFAADQLGRFNAACASADLHLGEPWLARNHVAQWLKVFDFPPAWERSGTQAAFSEPSRVRLEHLWAEHTRFLDACDQLPQVFSHYDYKHDNLFLRDRADGQREVVAVDWDICGLGPLGGNLAMLVGLSSWQHSWNPGQIAELAAAAYPAYIEGLRTGGWRGDAAQVRLAYTTWLATHVGLMTPACIAWAHHDASEYDARRLFGRPPAALPEGWVQVCAYALDCADEARQLLGW